MRSSGVNGVVCSPNVRHAKANCYGSDYYATPDAAQRNVLVYFNRKKYPNAKLPADYGRNWLACPVLRLTNSATMPTRMSNTTKRHSPLLMA
jgi:hypothetical protein